MRDARTPRERAWQLVSKIYHHAADRHDPKLEEFTLELVDALNDFEMVVGLPADRGSALEFAGLA